MNTAEDTDDTRFMLEHHDLSRLGLCHRVRLCCDDAGSHEDEKANDQKGKAISTAVLASADIRNGYAR